MVYLIARIVRRWFNGSALSRSTLITSQLLLAPLQLKSKAREIIQSHEWCSAKNSGESNFCIVQLQDLQKFHSLLLSSPILLLHIPHPGHWTLPNHQDLVLWCDGQNRYPCIIDDLRGRYTNAPMPSRACWETHWWRDDRWEPDNSSEILWKAAGMTLAQKVVQNSSRNSN